MASCSCPTKSAALSAYEAGDEAAPTLLAAALEAEPYDGAMLIAHAASLLRTGEPQPFDHMESVLARSPDWVDGHKALARLKAEAQIGNPLATLEAALQKLPNKVPKLAPTPVMTSQLR